MTNDYTFAHRIINAHLLLPIHLMCIQSGCCIWRTIDTARKEPCDLLQIRKSRSALCNPPSLGLRFWCKSCPLKVAFALPRSWRNVTHIPQLIRMHSSFHFHFLSLPCHKKKKINHLHDSCLSALQQVTHTKLQNGTIQLISDFCDNDSRRRREGARFSKSEKQK